MSRIIRFSSGFYYCVLFMNRCIGMLIGVENGMYDMIVSISGLLLKMMIRMYGVMISIVIGVVVELMFFWCDIIDVVVVNIVVSRMKLNRKNIVN